VSKKKIAAGVEHAANAANDRDSRIEIDVHSPPPQPSSAKKSALNGLLNKFTHPPDPNSNSNPNPNPDPDPDPDCPPNHRLQKKSAWNGLVNFQGEGANYQVRNSVLNFQEGSAKGQVRNNHRKLMENLMSIEQSSKFPPKTAIEKGSSVVFGDV